LSPSLTDHSDEKTVPRTRSEDEDDSGDEHQECDGGEDDAEEVLIGHTGELA
jgi:hypothetical protein